MDEGLLQLVRRYLQRTERVLKGRLDSSCGKASPSLADNGEIEKLNNCRASFVVDLAGELASVVVSENEEQWQTSQEVPLPGIRIVVKTGEDKKIIVSLQDPTTRSWLGLLGANVTEAGPVYLAAVTDREKRNGALVEWEMEVNKEDSAVRLVLAGYPYQLVGPPSPEGYFSLASTLR